MDRTQRFDALRHTRGRGAPALNERRATPHTWPRSPGALPAWGAAGDGMPHQNDPGPLAIAWRDRWILLLVALVTGTAVYGLSAQMPAIYAAETTLAFPYTSSQIALQGGDTERTRTLRTEAERITSQGLLEQAAEAIEPALDTTTLQQRVSATPASNADVITVRATAPDPREATTIANEVAAAYRRQVEWRHQNTIEDLERRERTLDERIATQQEQLARQLDDTTARADAKRPAMGSDPAISALRIALEASVSQLSDVQQRLDEARAKHETSAGGIQVLRPADLPGEPEQPRPVRNAATAVILALMAVTTIRWWRADPQPPVLEDAQSVEALLDVPVVGEIPFLRRPPGPAGVVTARYAEVVDAYRMVAAAIPVRGSVLVTGVRPDESCSDLVLNTAAVLSRDGYRVLLVEGDPQVGRLMSERADTEAGLTDVLAGQSDLRDSVLSGKIDDHAGVWLVPWGTRPSGLARSVRPRLGETLERFVDHADVVVIDGAPLASSADALTLAGHVDGILVAVSTGTPLRDIRRLRARLDQLDRPVLGAVVEHTARRQRRRRRRRRSSTVPVRWMPPRKPQAAQAESAGA